MNIHSPVEQFYAAIAAKFGVQKKFSELTPMEVNILCQGVSRCVNDFAGSP